MQSRGRDSTFVKHDRRYRQSTKNLSEYQKSIGTYVKQNDPSTAGETSEYRISSTKEPVRIPNQNDTSTSRGVRFLVPLSSTLPGPARSFIVFLCTRVLRVLWSPPDSSPSSSCRVSCGNT